MKTLMPLLCILAACYGPESGDFDFIELRRTNCYGSCPAYRVSVFRDGRVEYEGGMFVRISGRQTRHLTPGELRALRNEVSRVRYFRLRDSYRSKEDGCRGVWSDAPSAITTVRMRGRSKSIEHNYGCAADTSVKAMRVYPEALTRFESRIDEITGTAEWVGSAALHP